jgi:hypothetical protein
MRLEQRIEMFWNSATTATNARALTNQIEPLRSEQLTQRTETQQEPIMPYLRLYLPLQILLLLNHSRCIITSDDDQ